MHSPPATPEREQIQAADNRQMTDQAGSDAGVTSRRSGAVEWIAMVLLLVAATMFAAPAHVNFTVVSVTVNRH